MHDMLHTCVHLSTWNHVYIYMHGVSIKGGVLVLFPGVVLYITRFTRLHEIDYIHEIHQIHYSNDCFGHGYVHLIFGNQYFTSRVL